MRPTEAAIAVLQDAEERLREIAAGALADSDYESVGVVTGWAKALGNLYPRPAKRASARHQVTPTIALSSPSAMGTDTVRKLDPDEFPKFERQAKRLVKLGWSDRDKRIYEHRAPYEAVEEICRRFAEKAGSKKVLKIDKLLPMKTENGEELPSYQVYLVLKWLQQRGVIQKQGKDGYVIAGEDFDFKEIWQTTPAK